MSSISRRALLANTSVALSTVSGCTSSTPSPPSSGEDSDPHLVEVFLGDRNEATTVTVTITNQDGDALLEKDYHLTDSNEAGEVARFPASEIPETIVTTVDGTRFERNWSGFEKPELPCNGANEVGISTIVENAQDRTPDTQLLVDFQSITASNNSSR